jgi:hypothetical protein
LKRVEEIPLPDGDEGKAIEARWRLVTRGAPMACPAEHVLLSGATWTAAGEFAWDVYCPTCRETYHLRGDSQAWESGARRLRHRRGANVTFKHKAQGNRTRYARLDDEHYATVEY